MRYSEYRDPIKVAQQQKTTQVNIRFMLYIILRKIKSILLKAHLPIVSTSGRFQTLSSYQLINKPNTLSRTKGEFSQWKIILTASVQILKS